MKVLLALVLVLVLPPSNPESETGLKDKPIKRIQADACPEDISLVYGRIQFVDSFPDCKVKVVGNFEDMRVQVVEHFADEVGKWQLVESFPDFKVQLVESFPDFTIHFVDNFPGVDGD